VGNAEARHISHFQKFIKNTKYDLNELTFLIDRNEYLFYLMKVGKKFYQ